MNSLALAGACGGALYLGYVLYGRLMARLWDFQPDRPTPATQTPDGVDYVAAKHWTVLFGHHFASIAGVGPIVGPVLACAVWGWVPALLWIVLGSIFIGAVHDFSSLMASLRARGRSIAEIADAHLGHRVKLIFGAFLWLALLLVVAVFAHFGAQALDGMPQVVIPTFGVIATAVLVGMMMYRWGMPQTPATLIGLAMLTGFLVLGYYVPIKLPFGEQNEVAWTVVLLVYAYCASITPVNLLLQPRDYLSTFVLYAGMLAGYVGLLLTRPTVQAPPVQSYSGSQGPLPTFGSANQLIGALALVVVTVVLWRMGKPVIYTLVPAVFMLATTIAALIYQGREFVSSGKMLLAAISAALLVLALVMVVDSIRAVARTGARAGAARPAEAAGAREG